MEAAPPTPRHRAAELVHIVGVTVALAVAAAAALAPLTYVIRGLVH